MPVPSPNDACWMRLAKGAIPNFQTEHVALKFLLKRLQGDAVPPPVKVKELHDFFTKFERLLGKELTLLSR